jgi:Tol biopolymer transport system component
MQANQGSTKPALSADGQVVTFQSTAGNLVAGDTNGAIDIYMHDRRTKSTERVSLTGTGMEGTPESADALPSSTGAAISADGRLIAFESYARLSPDDANGRRDVYLRNRLTGTTARVSLPGAHGDVGGHLLAISGDGRSVAFVMEEVGPVVVHNREHGITDEVGHGVAPQFPNPGDAIAISHDGRFVTFAAQGNVLPDDRFIEST